MSKIKELKEQILKMFGTDNLFNYHYQILDDLEDAVREDERVRVVTEQLSKVKNDPDLILTTSFDIAIPTADKKCPHCKGKGCYSSGSNVMIVNCPFCESGRSLSSIQKSMRRK